VVLVEIYLVGRPVGELADLLAVSEDTVKAYAHQSLRVLRQALCRRLEDDERTTVVSDGIPTSREPSFEEGG
jgi:DNA-directed RNA polymerase specialized sigma24 family protein